MPPHTVRTTTVQAAHQRKEPVERGGGRQIRQARAIGPAGINRLTIQQDARAPF